MPVTPLTPRRRLAPVVASLAMATLAAACGGPTVESGGATPSTSAAPITTIAKTPASTASSSPVSTATTFAGPSTTAPLATTSTTKPSSTTTPAGDWPQVGGSDLQAPPGYTDLGGGSVSGSNGLAYTIFRTPAGGYVATIDQTTLDSLGRVATRTVKAVFGLPAPAAGETLANGCTNDAGSSLYVAYTATPPAGASTVRPTRAWLVNAGALRFDQADPQTVNCASNGS